MPAGSSRRAERGRAITPQVCLDIRIVSDATGGLARHFLASVLTQFGELEPKLTYYTFCDTETKLRRSLAALGRKRCIVFSTLARPRLKQIAEEVCRAAGVPHYDLTGGSVQFIEVHTGLQASNDVKAIHRNDLAYYSRIDALEFSLQHDDSRRIESIDQAEIVLAGISRVSKTPTSAYLGWLGYRVANVSLVPSEPIPVELRKCRRKTVGLTMRPKMLSEIRRRRLELNGFAGELTSDDGYVNLRSIVREVVQAEQVFRRLRVPVIDTSQLTIEEIATKVLTVLRRGALM